MIRFSGVRAAAVALSLALLAWPGAPAQAAGGDALTPGKTDGDVIIERAGKGGDWCLNARPSAALKKRIFRDWSPPASSRVADFVPMSAPTAQGWMLVEQWSPTFTGVALWNVRTNKMVKVHKFKYPANPNTGASRADQAMGSFDGRHALFMVSHSPYSFNDYFSTYLFDVKTGKLRHLDDNGTDARGNPFLSPAAHPQISGDYGAWVEGKSPRNSQVALVKLSTGKLTYLPRHSANRAEFYRGNLLVGEVVKGSQHWNLVSVPGGKRVPGPPVAAARKGSHWLNVAPSGAVAFANNQLTGLWYSPDGVKPAQRVATPPKADLSDGFALTGSALLFATQGKGSYYVDTSTKRGVRISTSQFFLARGRYAVTMDAEIRKGAPNTKVRIVDLTPGKLPPC